MRTDDAALRELYALLITKRRGTDAPAVSIEDVHALASGGPVSGDREALLDVVLGHPDTARELQFFMDLPRDTPVARRWFRSPGTLALAAGLLLAAGFALRTMVPVPAEDVMRSDAADVRLEPATALSGSPTTLVWHPVASATSYQLEVLREDGSAVLTQRVSDTTFAVALPAGALRWWVTATRDDGTTVRSAMEPITAGSR